jgi:hypothetical protein
MIYLAGLAAIPLGGVPRDVEPQLSAIAPEQCLWYASSTGFREPDPQSTHPTEQLFAEPEVRRFADELERQLLRAVRRAAGPNRVQRTLTAELPVILELVLSNPSASYVEEVEVDPQAGRARVEAAIVVKVGQDRQALDRSLANLLALMPPRATLETETLAAVSWSRVATPPRVPPIRWGWIGDYFAVAVGNETPQRLVDRMDGEAPAWLRAIRTTHPVDREATLGYLNVAGALELLRPFAERAGNQREAGPSPWQVIQALGFTQIKTLQAHSGWDATGCVHRGVLVMDGPLEGLPAMLPNKPLGKRDFRVVPHDPLAASVMRLDAGDVWDTVERLLRELDPPAAEQWGKHQWEIETRLGVNLRRDLVASLGDVWAVYVPGGDLMTAWLGSAAAVRVKDPDQLRESLGKLLNVARQQLSRGGSEGVTIRETRLDNHVIYSLDFAGAPVPVSPAWAVSDEWLVLGLLPQTVRAVLEREESRSLAEVPQVRQALDQAVTPAAVFYQDTPALVRSVYPWLQMGLQMASGPLRREGIDLDTTALPSLETLTRHLQPAVSSLAYDQDGFWFESHSSLPGEGNLAAATPVAAALLLPAVGGARDAARRTTEINHLKQLALAALNYESAYGKLPSDVRDESGKPLLSWRVRLLPFMEEQALYEEFRLDEPWDSDHNRRLLPRLPQVFQSPSGEGPRPHTTRFVALRGEGTLFPPAGEEIRFRDIRDGTSRTLLFVQAVPEAAVPWTQPADLDFDPQQPLNGLRGERGFFLAARCDGSCQTLSLETTSDDEMRSLASRAGED